MKKKKPSKTTTEIKTELEQLQARLRETQAREREEEAKLAGRRHRLLGIKLEQMMAVDPAVRARMAIEMNGFCTRRFDRLAFGFDAADNYFERLSQPKQAPLVGVDPALAAAAEAPSAGEGGGASKGSQAGAAQAPSAKRASARKEGAADLASEIDSVLDGLGEADSQGSDAPASGGGSSARSLAATRSLSAIQSSVPVGPSAGAR